MGASGGCGEIDIVEAIPGRSDQDLTSTYYSFKTADGAQTVFQRPANSVTTYIAIFDASGSGKLHLLEFPNFPFSNTISQSDVVSWIQNTPAREIVNLANPYSGPACSSSIFAGSNVAIGDDAVASNSATLSNQSTSNSSSNSLEIGLLVGATALVVVMIALVVVYVIRAKKFADQRV